MKSLAFNFSGAALHALPSGGLWWPLEGLYCASDLHFGKSERVARLGGALLPPYDTLETLEKLEEDLALVPARVVIALGDSFDDILAGENLSPEIIDRIQRLQAGVRWIWIAGNHDPAPMNLGGEHRAQVSMGGLVFRHEAEPGALGEVSGHYHPKTTIPLRTGSVTRACFLFDDRRLIMPAFGTYTGGLRSSDPVLDGLMSHNAEAILTGDPMARIPMQKGHSRR